MYRVMQEALLVWQVHLPCILSKEIENYTKIKTNICTKSYS